MRKILRLGAKRAAIVEELLAREARRLHTVIREAGILSRPVTPGCWRWADKDMTGYHDKSPAELEAMYARNAERRDAAEARLRLVQRMRDDLRGGRHNHFTRDIKPPGVCPACDSSRGLS